MVICTSCVTEFSKYDNDVTNQEFSKYDNDVINQTSGREKIEIINTINKTHSLTGFFDKKWSITIPSNGPNHTVKNSKEDTFFPSCKKLPNESFIIFGSATHKIPSIISRTEITVIIKFFFIHR